jgi:hypothetical protein
MRAGSSSAINSPGGKCSRRRPSFPATINPGHGPPIPLLHQITRRRAPEHRQARHWHQCGRSRLACRCGLPRQGIGEGGMMRTRESPLPIGRPKTIEPAACFQSSHTERRCQICGERPDILHIPTRHVGYFCGGCCPACREKPAAKE